MDPIVQLQQRVQHLEATLNKILISDKFLFQKPLIGGPNGLRLGSTALDKIGFYNQAPIAKWTSATARQDIVDGGGVASKVGTQWDGNTGTTYYSVGDIVAALKTYGLLAP